MQYAGTLYLYSGHPDRALELYEKVLELDPAVSHAQVNLGLCYVKKGLYDTGIQEIKKGTEMSKGFNPSTYSDLGYALSKAGRSDEARKVISDMLRYYEGHLVGASEIAFAYASVGDDEAALEWLETAYRERSGYVRSVSVDFGFEDMHSDPRFLAFLRKMGLFQRAHQLIGEMRGLPVIRLRSYPRGYGRIMLPFLSSFQKGL